MQAKEFLRVVTLRKGRLKPAEFRLREGDKGLSLFARVDHPGPNAVLEAVRAAGKQGNLGAAVITAGEIRALGLRLVQTVGGTPHGAVNAIHCEARLPVLRKLVLRLRGIRLNDYFNEHLSPRLCALARVLD
jgi:hypothetical protein